jgi:tetratricopeptide (TPR) repeat protein
MSAALTRHLRFATAAVAALAASALAGPAWGQPTPAQGRLTAQELGLAELPRIRNVQWGASYDAQRQAIAFARGVASAPSAAGLDQAAVAHVNTQMNSCSSGLADYWIDAYSCVAEGAMLLAQHAHDGREDQNYQQAIQTSYVTARLAMASPSQRRRPPRAVATWRQRAAEANQMLGDALLGRSRLTNNVLYAEQAIRAYQTSVSREVGDPNHVRYLALARVLADRGRRDEADDAYARLLDLPASPAFSTEDRVSALVARARLATNDQQRQRFLREAQQLGATSAEVNVEIGKFQREAGRTDEAWSLFDVASRMPASSGPVGPVNYTLEAFYYLSLVGADRMPPDWGQVYESANRAGASHAHYRRQACLSHIARGGEDYSGADISHDDAVGIVCMGSDGAEGQLLRGMYWLRRAQYVPNISIRANRDRWNDYLNRAAAAFAQGRAMASSVAAASEPFDWEGRLDPYARQRPASVGSMLTIGDALQFGETTVYFVRARCDGLQPAGRAQSLFDRYRVRGCTT